MKKKKGLYFMLPLVLLVWGIVFWQLYGYFFSPPSFATITEQKPIDLTEIKPDTFSIVAHYRDPFLGKKTRLKDIQKSHSSSAATKRKRAPVKAELPWPEINYGGMIKNNNSKKRVGIIRINGTEYLIKEKDELKAISILSISKNSIKVRFQQEIRILNK